jgi:hypothetical protein
MGIRLLWLHAEPPLARPATQLEREDAFAPVFRIKRAAAGGQKVRQPHHADEPALVATFDDGESS